jgi:hypothetical protein
MAVGLPLKVTYADGDVYAASDVNDTNGTINLLQTSTLSYQAGKNRIINGGMDIWQRGTSIAGTTTSFSADRWQSYRSVAGSTFSRQTVSDTTNLPNIQYCLRVQRDSGNTSTTTLNIAQNAETVNSIPLAGQKIAVSFYARKGANFSAAASNIQFVFRTGTGTDQNGLTAGFTGQVDLISQSTILTTTWQRFTYTATVASNVSQFAIIMNYTPVGTAGAADFFEVTGVQVELGSVATSFSRAGGNIQGELANCQRYYQKSYSQGTTVPTNSVAGSEFHQGYTTLNQFFSCGQTRFPVIMRIAPTVTVYSYASSTTSVISNNNGTDLAANSGVPVTITDRLFTVQNQNAAGQAATGGGFIYQYAASAEL